MLTELLENIGYIKEIIKLYDNHKLKCAFADEIEFDFLKLENAYSDLMLNFYLIYGATIIGAYIPPENQEHTINEIIKKYKTSIENMEQSVVQIGKTLKIHQDDLFKVIGNNHKKRMIMKDFLASINVDEQTVDWEYLSSRPHAIKAISNRCNTDFPNNLNISLEPLANEFKNNNVVWENINMGKLEQIWLNKEFRRRYHSLLKEFSE
jgi:hypothetical protein